MTESFTQIATDAVVGDAVADIGSDLSHLGLTWEHGEDELGTYRCAAVRVGSAGPSGALLRYEHDGITTVIMGDDEAADGGRDRFLAALGVRHEDLIGPLTLNDTPKADEQIDLAEVIYIDHVLERRAEDRSRALGA